MFQNAFEDVKPENPRQNKKTFLNIADWNHITWGLPTVEATKMDMINLFPLIIVSRESLYKCQAKREQVSRFINVKYFL